MKKTKQLPDGIYFDLDEKIYFDQERLNGSGCKNLAVSPGDFWAQSWLNPNKGNNDQDDTLAKTLGKAYHCAKLEPEKFEAVYLRRPVESDMPEGVLIKDEEIRAELKKLGLPMTKQGEKKEDRAMRLVKAGYDGVIFELVKSGFEMQVKDGQIPIDGPYYDQLIEDTAAIRSDKRIAPLISDGYAEVTILWTDERGIKWKARIDYLKTDKIVDLKTFDNFRRKPSKNTLIDAFRYEKYWLSARLYWKAVELAKSPGFPVFGNEKQFSFVDEMRENKAPHEFFYIWQQKGGVPNVYASHFKQTIEPVVKQPQSEDDVKYNIAAHKNPNALARKADAYINFCASEFLRYFEVYGADKWYPLDCEFTIDDDDFSEWFLNGEDDA